MHVIQIFLPVRDNNDQSFPGENYTRIRQALATQFGGLTAYTRAPAEGLWKDEQNAARHDDIVIFEVMAAELDEQWWQEYKQELVNMFSQDDIIIRVQNVLLL
ncbi:MAG: hypothetical protein H8K03_20175 [Nitrospira sp.]|jgi:2-hydroxychromene-2-carboxylate isomerase|nr:hypothetical protein [Nitrospira sp. BO4]